MSEKDNLSAEGGAVPPDIEIDTYKLERFMQGIRDNQNLSMGLLGGLSAAALGATIWATITYATDFQIGFMAIGIGFIVGLAVRKMGAGIDQSFGIVGATCSLLGCLAGNILTIYITISNSENVPLMDVISQLDSAALVEIMKEWFNPMDILFYGLAVYYGYKYSIRQITADELRQLVKTS